MYYHSRLTQFLEILRAHKKAIEEQYHVSSLAVFGSYVRHEEKKQVI